LVAKRSGVSPRRTWPCGHISRASFPKTAGAPPPIWRPFMWTAPRSPKSETLEAIGVERDLLHTGTPAEAIAPLLEVMRANLGHLNEWGEEVWSGSQVDLLTPEVQHD